MRLRNLVLIVLLAVGGVGDLAFADRQAFDGLWDSPYRDDRGNRNRGGDRGRNDDRDRGEDRDRDRDRQRERKISLDQAVDMVQRRYKAQVVRADTHQEGDRTVYRLRLLNSDKKVWTVTVDASTGSIR